MRGAGAAPGLWGSGPWGPTLSLSLPLQSHLCSQRVVQRRAGGTPKLDTPGDSPSSVPSCFQMSAHTLFFSQHWALPPEPRATLPHVAPLIPAALSRLPILNLSPSAFQWPGALSGLPALLSQPFWGLGTLAHASGQLGLVPRGIRISVCRRGRVVAPPLACGTWCRELPAGLGRPH